jgi:hypothetical protein
VFTFTGILWVERWGEFKLECKARRRISWLLEIWLRTRPAGKLGALPFCVCMRWGKYMVSLSSIKSKWANDVCLAFVTKEVCGLGTCWVNLLLENLHHLDSGLPQKWNSKHLTSRLGEGWDFLFLSDSPKSQDGYKPDFILSTYIFLCIIIKQIFSYSLLTGRLNSILKIRTVIKLLSRNFLTVSWGFLNLLFSIYYKTIWIWKIKWFVSKTMSRKHFIIRRHLWSLCVFDISLQGIRSLLCGDTCQTVITHMLEKMKAHWSLFVKMTLNHD